MLTYFIPKRCKDASKWKENELLNRQDLANLLRCPETGNPLTGWNGTDAEATLRTACGRTYQVVDGIPNLLPDALRTAEAPEDSTAREKRSEMAARDAQVGSYDQMMGLKLFTSFEVPKTLAFLDLQLAHIMLEGGCGTGRMTPAFVDACSAMICVDFSRESLRVAKTKLSLKQLEKVIFVQADLSMLPVASDVFDRVGSFGVYEHIPTVATRAGAIAHMARVCKSKAAGGRFSMSAYRWGFPQSLFSEREGHHGGGIYFIRLTQAELRADMEAHFKVEGFTESLLYYHLAWGHKK